MCLFKGLRRVKHATTDNVSINFIKTIDTLSVKVYIIFRRLVKQMREVKKPEKRRAEILAMSKSLFIQKGYLNTTTQDIISALKISRGLLYYHFKSKEDILWHIAEQQTTPLFRRIDAVVNNESMNSIEKIRNFFIATMTSDPSEEITEEEAQLMESLQNAMQLPENTYMMDKINHRISYRVSKQFCEVLEQGNKEGLLDVAYPEEVASYLMTAFTFVMNDQHYHQNDLNKTMQYYTAFTHIVNQTLGAKETILKNDFQ